MTEHLKIGYIGLGLMGKSIARNILRAGFPLVVHNRSQFAVAELVGGALNLTRDWLPRWMVFTNLPDTRMWNWWP
jgi:2-hydroxy-3-oxopropionate reductase